MKIRVCLAAAFVACGLFQAAHGALIVNDNFDGYANQAAFEAAWPAIGTTAPQSAVLSTAQSVSAPNSVQVPGTATNNQYRNQQIFTETSTFSSSGNLGIGDQLIWSFDYYDSTPAGSPQRNFSNLQDSTAPSSTNQLISMGLNNNQSAANSGGNYYMARILGYDATTGADPNGGPAESVAGSGAYFKLNDFGVGLRSAGWHNLKAVMSTDDGLSTDYAFYVDNQLAELVSNVGTAASIRSYDNIRIGSGLSNGSTEVFFDNMRLEYVTVPEPAAVVLLGVAAAAFGCLRRRVG
jgi:hypothetical protein